MKRIIVIITFLLAGVLLLSQPIIEFETLVYDFGRIKEEEGPHGFDFKFSNTGDESFRLIRVKAGWGCTVPSWSTDEILPGQTGVISVQFDSNNRPGSFSKSIKVNTSIDDKTIKLITKGFVKATPGKLRKKIGPLDADKDQINFGEMFFGARQTKRIKIHNTKEDTMYISLTGEYNGIEIEVEPAILYPANYGELVVHFNSGNRDFGKMTDMIQLNIEFANKKQQGYLVLNTNIIEDFSALTQHEKANPPKIKISVNNKTFMIKDLTPDELRTEVIEIENMGTRDLYIRNIQSLDDKFSIDPSKFIVKPGKKSSFNINVTPDTGVNKLKSIITIISNDPKQSIISFTIIGKVDLPEGSSNKKIANDIRVEKAANIVKSFKGKDELIILDVRTEEEYNNGCVEDAVNVDFNNSNFRKILKSMDKQKTYLVYCQSGIRSKKAVSFMSEMGFKEIYHMHEGIEGWKALRLKLTDPNK